MASEDPSHIEFWKNRWEMKETGWHLNDINPILRDFLPFLTGDAENQKIFVPLCGKSKDVPFLASLGHRVFGVEGVREAIENLDQENKLNLKFSQESSTYSSDDGRIVIYYGDFFACPYENFGPFDAVWDRGSFIALEYQFRENYSKTMERIFKGNSFKYLLETVKYDKSKFGGPPRSVDEQDIRDFFANWANVEEAETEGKYAITKEFLDKTKLDNANRIIYKITQ